MQLTINGEARTLDPVDTVDAMLRQLGLDPRGVVVELNRAIIRRADVTASRVHDGDTVEIVHFVGGG
ncbi:MAG: sulfur carrier protein ThiS [Gemmatimonadales bacterium]